MRVRGRGGSSLNRGGGKTKSTNTISPISKDVIPKSPDDLPLSPESPDDLPPPLKSVNDFPPPSPKEGSPPRFESTNRKNLSLAVFPCFESFPLEPIPKLTVTQLNSFDIPQPQLPIFTFSSPVLFQPVPNSMTDQNREPDLNANSIFTFSSPVLFHSVANSMTDQNREPDPHTNSILTFNSNVLFHSVPNSTTNQNREPGPNANCIFTFIDTFFVKQATIAANITSLKENLPNFPKQDKTVFQSRLDEIKSSLDFITETAQNLSDFGLTIMKPFLPPLRSPDSVLNPIWQVIDEMAKNKPKEKLLILLDRLKSELRPIRFELWKALSLQELRKGFEGQDVPTKGSRDFTSTVRDELQLGIQLAHTGSKLPETKIIRWIDDFTFKVDIVLENCNLEVDQWKRKSENLEIDLQRAQNALKQKEIEFDETRANLKGKQYELEGMRNDLKLKEDELEGMRNEFKRTRAKLDHFQTSNQTLEHVKQLQNLQMQRMSKALQAQMEAVTAQYEQRIERLKEIHAREIEALSQLT
jgi:hypothetical protein